MLLPQNTSKFSLATARSPLATYTRFATEPSSKRMVTVTLSRL